MNTTTVYMGVLICLEAVFTNYSCYLFTLSPHPYYHTYTHMHKHELFFIIYHTENSNSRTGWKDHQTSNCKFPKHLPFCIDIEG